MPDELPESVVRTAERLTRVARRADDPERAAAARERRAALLEEHGFVARVREGGDATLVLYPRSWLDETGTVRVEAVEDTDRAVERTLEGAGDPEDWEAVADHNAAVAERVRERHGSVHGANAAAFAEFMSNHYAKRVGAASRREVAEFLEEYFPRNAWPTAEQREVVERSVELVRASVEE